MRCPHSLTAKEYIYWPYEHNELSTNLVGKDLRKRYSNILVLQVRVCSPSTSDINVLYLGSKFLHAFILQLTRCLVIDIRRLVFYFVGDFRRVCDDIELRRTEESNQIISSIMDRMQKIENVLTD